MIPALIFAFFMALLSNAIHLEAILGAFAAGLVLDETFKSGLFPVLQQSCYAKAGIRHSPSQTSIKRTASQIYRSGQ
ncbi:hypothetical protein [Phormidium sp. FACHB-592]|uniref:hypothetical protein n=1 Tax=Cyanophyceae TaxID=3028117 RepID=UPI00321FE637